MWAVLDRQWWLRWQCFTGCHESEPGYGHDRYNSGDTGDDVKQCNENGDGTGRGLALGMDEKPRAENGYTQESGAARESGNEKNKKIGEKEAKEKVEMMEKLEDGNCKEELKGNIGNGGLGENEAKNAKENKKATKNQEQEGNDMGDGTKEGYAAAVGGTPKREDPVPESGEKKQPWTVTGGSSDSDGCCASSPGSVKTGDRAEGVVPVATGKEETKNMEGGVGDGDTIVGTPGSSGETEVTSLRGEHGNMRTGRRKMAVEVVNGGELGQTVFFDVV